MLENLSPWLKLLIRVALAVASGMTVALLC